MPKKSTTSKKPASGTKKRTRTSVDHEFAKEIGAMGGKAKAANNKGGNTGSNQSNGKKRTRTSVDHEFAQEIGAMGGRAKAANSKKNSSK